MSVRGALLLGAGLLSWLGTASAQDTPGTLPPGPGTLRGRIVHEDGGAVADLPVVLYAAPEEGAPGLARTRSDASGAFAFDGISNDPALAYLVGVHAEGLPFGARASFEPGETAHEIQLRIAMPKADGSGVVRRSVRLRIDRGCDGLRVVETHALANPGERAVFLVDAQREGGRPLLEVELPAAAGEISLPLASQGLERDGSRVRFWGPLHAGEHELEFSYSVPATGGESLLRWRLLQGVERVEILTDPRGPRATGPGFAAGPPDGVDGHRYATQARGPIEPGGEISLRVELPPAAESPLAISEARAWLELDDAALVVDQQLRLAVEGSEPLAAGSTAPLLCLAIPAEAEALRFSPETLAMGAEPDPSGALALRGPIPAGESSLALRYRIPVGAAETDFVQRFDRAVDVLSVLVADTGVAVETTRLHRRRPVQSGDRSFLHLEGFQLDADEPVAIRLERLAPRHPPPRAATLGFSVALAAAAIAFLAGPLRARRDEAGVDPAIAALDTEREAVLSALRSLEEDFETGKLDAADHAELRGELRARAAELIQRRRVVDAERAGDELRERAAERVQRRRVVDAGPAAAERATARAAKPACGSCAAELVPDARFCHRCGAARPDAGGAD